MYPYAICLITVNISYIIRFVETEYLLFKQHWRMNLRSVLRSAMRMEKVYIYSFSHMIFLLIYWRKMFLSFSFFNGESCIFKNIETNIHIYICLFLNYFIFIIMLHMLREMILHIHIIPQIYKYKETKEFWRQIIYNLKNNFLIIALQKSWSLKINHCSFFISICNRTDGHIHYVYFLSTQVYIHNLQSTPETQIYKKLIKCIIY